MPLEAGPCIICDPMLKTRVLGTLRYRYVQKELLAKKNYEILRTTMFFMCACNLWSDACFHRAEKTHGTLTNPCCGSGPGIQWLIDPGIRDGKNPDLYDCTTAN